MQMHAQSGAGEAFAAPVLESSDRLLVALHALDRSHADVRIRSRKQVRAGRPVSLGARDARAV